MLNSENADGFKRKFLAFSTLDKPVVRCWLPIGKLLSITLFLLPVVPVYMSS